jgi:hypothetical protein
MLMKPLKYVFVAIDSVLFYHARLKCQSNLVRVYRVPLVILRTRDASLLVPGLILRRRSGVISRILPVFALKMLKVMTSQWES